MKSKNSILGSFEVVSLPDLGLLDTVAKVDTGAYSGAVHCTNIKLVRRGVTGKRILKFTPAGKTDLAQETSQFEKRRVRSSNGKLHTRYLIKTTLVVQGKPYKVTIGLTDRSDMKKQVLVGRKFIRDSGMLVDVAINAQYDDEGENTL